MVRSNKNLSILISLCVLSILFAIAGCGSSNINILMKSTDDSNEMNAIQIKICQLKSPEKFKLASKESLLRNIDDTLGDDLIPTSKIEKIMIPGESYSIKDLKVKEGTKFIGIIGDFYNPAKDRWSQLIDVSEGNSDIKIIIGKNFISITE